MEHPGTLLASSATTVSFRFSNPPAPAAKEKEKKGPSRKTSQSNTKAQEGAG